MADKKILSAVRVGGRRFNVDVEQDAEDLDKVLTPEDVKRLKESDPPVLSGDFKGKKDPEKVTRALTNEGPARPQGVKLQGTRQAATTAEPKGGSKPKGAASTLAGTPWSPQGNQPAGGQQGGDTEPQGQ